MNMGTLSPFALFKDYSKCDDLSTEFFSLKNIKNNILITRGYEILS